MINGTHAVRQALCDIFNNLFCGLQSQNVLTRTDPSEIPISHAANLPKFPYIYIYIFHAPRRIENLGNFVSDLKGALLPAYSVLAEKICNFWE